MNITVFSNLSILLPTIQLFYAIYNHQPSGNVVGVCLEGDTTLRLDTTLSLYRKKVINHVIVSGGVKEDKALDEMPANKMRSYLIDKGIPSNAIDIDAKSLTTHDHPINVLDIAQKKGFNELMLITSRHHLVRAYLRFLRVIIDDNLPTRLYGYPAGSFISLFHKIPKQGHYRIKIFLSNELLKIKTYYGLASFKEAHSFLQQI